MRPRRLATGFARALLYSLLVFLPFFVPAIFLAYTRDGDGGARGDRKVAVGADTFAADYERFAPRQILEVGVHIDDLANIDLTGRTFNARFVLWGKSAFDLSRNDRSRFAADELRVRNGAELAVEPRAARPVPGTAEEGAEPELLAYIADEVDGSLRAEYRLRRFPFDAQTLSIVVEPRTRTAEEMLLVVDPAAALAGEIDLGEWRVTRFDGRAEIHEVRSDYSDPVRINQGSLFNHVSRATFTVTVERRVLSHLLKDLLPLLVILLVAYCNFFIKNSWFDARSCNAITALLAVVALHWSARSDLPGVAYLTAMDEFFLVAYPIVFLTMMDAVIALRVSPEEGEEVEGPPHFWLRVVQPALRFLYPLFLFGGWALVVLRAVS